MLKALLKAQVTEQVAAQLVTLARQGLVRAGQGLVKAEPGLVRAVSWARVG